MSGLPGRGGWRRAVPAGLLLALATTAGARAAPEFTRDFRLEDCTWSAWGRQNPYFSLRPGRQLVLEGHEDGTEVRAEVTMLKQLETITFLSPRNETVTVVARVMEERELEDGELVEVSRNWVARCVETSDVFYFGEEVDNYEDGVLVSHEGAWRAGQQGAQPGVLFPGRFLLGARYFQEIAPGVALDRGENTRMGFTVSVPAGTFGDCVEVSETDPLGSSGGADIKVYCAGVGIVRDEFLELVDIRVVP